MGNRPEVYTAAEETKDKESSCHKSTIGTEELLRLHIAQHATVNQAAHTRTGTHTQSTTPTSSETDG